MARRAEGRDWSQLDVEGTDSESVNEDHERVEHDLDEAVKESKRLTAIVQQLPRNQNPILWLKGVAPAVQIRDLEEYFEFRNVTAIRIFPSQWADTYKIFMDQQNALKFISIPDHVPNRKLRCS